MKRYLGVDLHRTQFVVCTWENTKDEFRGGAVPIAAKLVLTLGAHE